MPRKALLTFNALTCLLKTKPPNSTVVLKFYDRDNRVQEVILSNMMMAELAGQFLRKGIFGLH